MLGVEAHVGEEVGLHRHGQAAEMMPPCSCASFWAASSAPAAMAHTHDREACIDQCLRQGLAYDALDTVLLALEVQHVQGHQLVKDCGCVLVVWFMVVIIIVSVPMAGQASASEALNWRAGLQHPAQCPPQQREHLRHRVCRCLAAIRRLGLQNQLRLACITANQSSGRQAASAAGQSLNRAQHKSISLVAQP